MPSARPRSILTATTLALILLGCSGEPADRPDRTDRERDSLIGQSALPGAQGVRGALRAQDTASARAARIDSIANANQN